MTINLEYSRVFDAQNSRMMDFDENMSCKEALKLICDELEIEDHRPYKLLIYKGNVREPIICDLNQPLIFYAKPGGRIIPSKEHSKCKITRDEEETAKMRLDLSIPVDDVLSYIADELQLYCQPDQYSLWYYNDEGYKFPLESNRPICVQTTYVSKFYFKRRYFLIFSYDFEDMDNCIHVFRDCKYNYTHSNINVSEDQAFELARLILYGTTTNLKDLNIDLISERFKDFVPKQFRDSSFMANKCKKYITQQAAMDKLPAMIQFIKTVREIKGFGEEIYNANLTDNNYKSKKVALCLLSRGVRVCERGTTDGLFNIHTSSIKEYGYAGKVINIRYVDPKTNKENTCHFTVKSTKVANIHTYLVDIAKLYVKFLKTKNSQRIIRKKQKKKIEVTSPEEAEAVITTFLSSEILNRAPETSSDRLRVETEPELLKRDDYSSFNEVQDVSDLIRDEEEFAKMVTTHLPKYNLEYFDLHGTVQRLEAIMTSIRAQVDNSFKMTIKDASYSVECALFYINAISDGFHSGDIKKEMEVVAKVIQVLFVMIKQSDTMKLGITDIRQQVIDGYTQIVDSIPPVIEKIKSIIEQTPEPPVATKEELHALPRGSIYLSTLVEAIYRLMGYLFNVRLDLLNADLNILKLFPVLSKFAMKAYKFWKELDENNCDIKANLNDLILTYREIYPYLQHAYTAYKMPAELLNDFHAHFRRVLNFTWLGLICFVNKDETVGIKFFPGPCYLRHGALNTLSDAVTYFTQMMNLPNIQPDQKLMEPLRKACAEFENTSTVTRTVMNDMVQNPTNDALRFVVIQSVNVSRRYFFEVLDYCVKMGPNIQPEIVVQVRTFLNSVDSFLYSLSPMNISSTRVRTFAESLTALVQAMKDTQCLDEYIPSMTESRDNFIEWNKVLAGSPTDGKILFKIHQSLHSIATYVISLQSYLENANHKTIPLIIEVMMPSITKTLANPEIRDDYEKCKHVPAFCQFHMNVAKLITFLTNVILTPQVAVQENVLAKLSSKLTLLKEDYNRLTQIRPHLMQNAFSYQLSCNIKNIINNMYVNLANIIDDTENIAAVTCANASVVILADVFKSARLYFDKCKEVNIRPYMKNYTKEEIVAYRKEVIKLMACFREYISQNTDLKYNPLVEKENSEIKDIIKDLMKFEADPSTNFNLYTPRIHYWLTNMYARTNYIPGLWDEKKKGVLDALTQRTDVIMSGEKPSPQILTNVINALIAQINEYPGQIQSVAQAADDKNIKQFMSILKGILNALTTALKTSKFKPKEVEEIRRQLVNYQHYIPELTTQVKENPFTKKLLTAYDDLINLTRQMLMPSSIDYIWDPIQEVDSNDIGELAAALKKMFEYMTKIFSELEYHPIVDDSIRISMLIRQVSSFYSTNASVLNMSREQLESNLPQFCRNIEAELEAMINLIKLLGPILSDRQLIDTCEAVQKTVNNVIKLSDKHFLTTAKATEFATITYPLLQKLVLKINNVVKNGSVNDSKEFLEEYAKKIGEIPPGIEQLKPHEIQAISNKIYEFLMNGFEKARPDFDPTEIAEMMYESYNQFSDYISLEKKPVSMVESLIVNPKIFEGKNAAVLVQKEIDSINGEPVSEEDSKQAKEIIKLSLEQTSNVPASLRYLANYLSSSQNISAKHSYSRYLSIVQENHKATLDNLLNIIIQSSIEGAKIIEAMKEEIKNTKMRTVFHRQLQDSLKNADFNMITTLKNMASVTFAYAPIRVIRQLATLSCIKEEKFSQMTKALNESIDSCDLVIQTVLANTLLQIAKKCEELGVFKDFVLNIANLLRKPHYASSFDAELTSKLINTFLTFDNQSNATIHEKADNKDYQELKSLIESLSSIRPLLQQLSSPTAARQEQTLKNLLQAIYQMFLSYEKGEKDLEEYERVRSLAKIASYNLHTAQEQGVNVTPYLDALKQLDKAVDDCDYAALAITKGGDAKLIGDPLDNLIKALAMFFKAAGDIEADEEEEVHEEEEQKKEEEVKIVYVDVQEELQNLLTFALEGKYQELIDLAAKCLEAIEKDHQCPELDGTMKDLIKSVATKNQEGINNFIKWIANKDYANWVKTTKKPQSAKEVESVFIDTIDEFRAIRNVFGKNPKQDIRDLVKVCARSQSLVGIVLPFFEYINSSIYEFYLQTANQLWPNVMNVIKNVNEPEKYKLSLRSIARLISDFSYIVEDCVLQDSKPSTTQLNEARFKYGKSSANMIKSAGEMLYCIAISRYSHLYDLHIEAVKDGYADPLTNLEIASKELLKANLKPEVGQEFTEHFKEVQNSYNNTFEMLNKLATPEQAVSNCIAVFKAAYVAFCDLKSMSDVVEKKKDPESAKKLPVKFTIPTISAEIANIEEVNKVLEMNYNSYQKEIDWLSHALAENSEISNEQIVEKIILFHDIAKELVGNVLKASVACIDVGDQSNLTGLANNIVATVNDITKCVKAFLMVETGWRENFETTHTESTRIITDVNKVVEHSIQVAKTKSIEEDLVRRAIGDLAKPFFAISSSVQEKTEETNKLAPSVSREYGLTLAEVTGTLSSTLAKIIMYLRDRQQDMTVPQEKLKTVSEDAAALLNAVISAVLAIANSNESEDQVIENATKIIRTVEAFKGMYRAQRGELLAHNEALNGVVNISKKLIQAAEAGKKARLERIEALKRREEEAAKRRAAAEERRRLAAERRANAKPTHQPPKEMLMKLLKLESDIIKARLYLRQQKKVVDQLNAE